VRKLLLAAVAISALATSFVAPAQAGPPEPGPTGRLCGYFATSDPNPEAPTDAMTGVVYGGTLTWNQPFTLHCYLRVNINQHCPTANHPTCAAFDAHASSTEAPPGTHSATLSPTPVNYTSGEFDQDYLCTAVSYAGGDLYWHPAEDPDGIPGTGDETTGHWTKDVTKPCSAATQFSTGPIIRFIDSVIVCPVLLALNGSPVDGLGGVVWIDSEGDLFLLGPPSLATLFWDCQKYIGPGPFGGDENDGVFDAP